MMNSYDYTKPLANPRTIEHNRRILQSEAKFFKVDPNIVNSLPIPTNPMSVDDARQMLYNAYSIQCERNCMNFSGTGYYNPQNNISDSSSTSSGCGGTWYTGNHPALVGFLMGLGGVILCFLPFLIF